MSTSAKKPGSNGPTHHKRLARAFAAASGRPYAQALQIVRAAAAAGRLPSPLDADGIRAAVDILMGVERLANTESAAAPNAETIPSPWTRRPSFGLYEDDQERAELDSHLLVLGSSGQGKTVALATLARDALVLGWEVAYVDLIKGASELPYYASVEGSENLVRVSDEEALTTLLDRLVDNLIDRRRGEGHMQDAPSSDDLRPFLLVIDECGPLFARDHLTKQVDRLLASGRSVGIHVAMATQDASSDRLPAHARTNADRLLLGRTSTAQRYAALARPETAPESGRADLVGTGVYECHDTTRRVRVTPLERGTAEMSETLRSWIPDVNIMATRLVHDLIPREFRLELAEEVQQIALLEACELSQRVESGSLALSDDDSWRPVLQRSVTRKVMAYLEQALNPTGKNYAEAVAAHKEKLKRVAPAVDESELPRRNTLWWAPVGDPADGLREMVKVSEWYRDSRGFVDKISAQVVMPVPQRTTVRFWTPVEARAWKPISNRDYDDYIKAYGG